MITLKRGDTFSFSTNLTDNLGNILTGITSNLRCQIRDISDKLISEMIIEETDTNGEYIFKVDDTNNFPIQNLYFDIEYIDQDITISSETFEIEVVKDVTHND